MNDREFDILMLEIEDMHDELEAQILADLAGRRGNDRILAGGSPQERALYGPVFTNADPNAESNATANAEDNAV